MDTKTKRSPAAGDDANRRGAPWESLLDQPSGIDPFHPHLAVKPCPGINVVPDIEKLIGALARMREMHLAGRKMTISQGDFVAGETAQSVRRIVNGLVDDKK